MAMPRGSEPDAERKQQLTHGLPTKAAKIRALGAAGYTRSQIAAFMGISYQHVRGVLVRSTVATPAQAEQQSDDDLSERGRAEIDASGAVHFPVQVLERLGLRPGGVVPWRVENDELVLVSPASGWRRAQAILDKYLTKEQRASLVDDFLEFKREEARREQERGF